MIWIEVCI